MTNIPTSFGQPIELEVGPFTAGEIPEPLEIQFTREDGSVIELSSADQATFRWGIMAEGAAGQNSADATVVDADDIVRYQWQDGDLASSGYYQGVMWVERSGRRLASMVLGFIVWQPPYPHP